jgi:hypothetical protein
MMIAQQFVPRLMVLGFAACIVATLATPALATAQSRMPSRVNVTLTCTGRTTVGRGEILVGRALLSLACSPAAPVAIGDPELIGDPNTIPWAVRLGVRDAPGSITSCTARGTGLPARLACHAVSDPEDFVDIVMQSPPEPE